MGWIFFIATDSWLLPFRHESVTKILEEDQLYSNKWKKEESVPLWSIHHPQGTIYSNKNLMNEISANSGMTIPICMKVDMKKKMVCKKGYWMRILQTLHLLPNPLQCSQGCPTNSFVTNWVYQHLPPESLKRSHAYTVRASYCLGRLFLRASIYMIEMCINHGSNIKTPNIKLSLFWKR